MRQFLKFLILMIACSCGQRNEHSSSKQEYAPIDSAQKADSFKTSENIKNEITESSLPEWEKHEDSLRNIILKSKNNTILKKSFLQEMYIRNVITVSKDSLLFNIPFNLHGLDCIAPDCYSTDISFSFKLDDSLIFPKSFFFQEHEYGCVEKERKLSGKFQLVEQNDKHIIYHSKKDKRTLVLFSNNKYNGTTAYYFRNVGLNRINGRNIYTIKEDYNEEIKNSVYPLTSWALTTNEYENFIQKK